MEEGCGGGWVSFSSHQKALISDRLLTSFSPTPSKLVVDSTLEFNEEDFFWFGSSADSHNSPSSSPSSSPPPSPPRLHPSLLPPPPPPAPRPPPPPPSSSRWKSPASIPVPPSSVRRRRVPLVHSVPKSFGIVAALCENEAESSSSFLISSNSRPFRYRSTLKPNQSPPMRIPRSGMASRNICSIDDTDVKIPKEYHSMLPPHEIVARSAMQAPLFPASVLEGGGRTLKGKDMRHVRDDVMRKTCFR